MLKVILRGARADLNTTHSDGTMPVSNTEGSRGHGITAPASSEHVPVGLRPPPRPAATESAPPPPPPRPRGAAAAIRSRIHRVSGAHGRVRIRQM